MLLPLRRRLCCVSPEGGRGAEAPNGAPAALAFICSAARSRGAPFCRLFFFFSAPALKAIINYFDGCLAAPPAPTHSQSAGWGLDAGGTGGAGGCGGLSTRLAPQPASQPADASPEPRGRGLEGDLPVHQPWSPRKEMPRGKSLLFSPPPPQCFVPSTRTLQCILREKAETKPRNLVWLRPSKLSGLKGPCMF